MSPRQAARAAAEEDLSCLLCGAQVHALWHEDAQEWQAYELCPDCNRAFQAAANRAASWIIQPARHNFEDAACGHPNSVGVFPVAGAVCPLCRPEVPGQLALGDQA